MLLSFTPNTHVLDTVTAHWQSISSALGLATSISVAIAAGFAASYFIVNRSLKRARETGQGNISNIAITLNHSESAATFFTIATAVLGLLGSVASARYIWFNQQLEVLRAEQISEADNKSAAAIQQQRILEQDNILLRGQIADLTAKQTVLATHSARAYAGLISAKNQLAQLELKNKPRTLSGSQKDLLIKALSLFPNQKVTVDHAQGDAEARGLAFEFIGIFQKAGWQFLIYPYSDKAPFSGAISPEAWGVQYILSEQTTSRPAANALKKALQDIGMEVQGIIYPGPLEADTVYFWIGGKTGREK